MWGPFLRTRKSVDSKRRAAKIFDILVKTLTPHGCDYVSRCDIERGLDVPELSPIASSNLDRLLKDMEDHGLVGKKKVRDNDLKTGNPERTYYRLSSLIFSPDYNGNDLKKQFMEFRRENENLSMYIKEMFIFLRERGLMDEWTARQARRMEENYDASYGRNGKKQDRAFMAMMKSSLIQFRIYRRKFNKRTAEEVALLITSGKYSEFIARVESIVGRKTVAGKR